MSSSVNTEQMYRRAYMIRKFEEMILDLFSQGKIRGTTHTYSGQEANAVAIAEFALPQDCWVSHHRSHGHFLARYENPHALFAEIMGKQTGVSKGRGGSQHLCYKNFFSNGILGGISATAAGLAMAQKRKKDGGITVLFATDGMLGQGVFYETMNMISLWQLPVLIVVEHNQYAQSTPTKLELAGSAVDRGKGFGIESHELASFDACKIHSFLDPIIRQVRKNVPQFVVLHTYRFGPHSKGDDFRDPSEIAEYRKKDPLNLISQLDELVAREIQVSVDKLLKNDLKKALSDPDADFIEAFSIDKSIFSRAFSL